MAIALTDENVLIALNDKLVGYKEGDDSIVEQTEFPPTLVISIDGSAVTN